ncbi:MAG: peptidylprolyl isomerase [Cyanobacteria bacterium P01_F01_bin.4]
MEPAIQVGPQRLDTPELIQKIRQYRLLPKLVQELVIDRLIADIPCDQQVAYDDYCVCNQLVTEEQRQAWCQQHQLESEHLMAEAIREYRLNRFKEDTWGSEIQNYFLKRKPQLDRVIYSLIRTKDAGLAQELHFRLRDDANSSFADLARQYSDGKEAQTGGLAGPIELSVPHPTLGRMLQVSRPSQLWPPTQIGEWLVIVRLEKLIPAQFDDAMRQRLLNEQFQGFLKQQMQANPVKLLALREQSAEPDSVIERVSA